MKVLVVLKAFWEEAFLEAFFFPVWAEDNFNGKRQQ